MESAPTSAVSPAPPDPASRRRNWSQIIIAIAVIIYLCNELQVVFIVLLVSILLAFILAPIADVLQRLRLPRAIASLVPVLLLLAVIAAVSYGSYNQAATFVENLPQYSGQIRAEIGKFRERVQSFESRIEGAPAT